MDPPAGTEALLFDCDGTLVDTMGLYRICWRQVFGRHGFEMSDEWFDTWAGHSMTPFVEAALGERGPCIRGCRREGGCRALPRVRRTCWSRWTTSSRSPGATTGASPWPSCRAARARRSSRSLDAVGITDLFDVVVTVSDVAARQAGAGRLPPAIELLGVRPEACVAYEDTASGMESARGAGIPAIVDVRWHDA